MYGRTFTDNNKLNIKLDLTQIINQLHFLMWQPANNHNHPIKRTIAEITSRDGYKNKMV